MVISHDTTDHTGAPATGTNRIVRVAGCGTDIVRPISYWAYVDRAKNIPTEKEFLQSLKDNKYNPDIIAIWDCSAEAKRMHPENEYHEQCFAIWDFDSDHQYPGVEEKDIAQDVKDWASEEQLEALQAGRKVFHIQENGDSHSDAWEATRIDATGFIYQGDAPNLSKEGLETWLYSTYPRCVVFSDCEKESLPATRKTRKDINDLSLPWHLAGATKWMTIRHKKGYSDDPAENQKRRLEVAMELKTWTLEWFKARGYEVKCTLKPEAEGFILQQKIED